MKPEEYPTTPNLDIQAKVIESGQAQAISDFLDFLFDEKGFVLAQWVPYTTWVDGGTDHRLERTSWGESQRREMIERFFGMDPQKASEERDAVYRWVAAQANEARA